MNWRDRAHNLGHRAERRWDALRRGTKAALGWRDPVTIQPFRGYGDAHRLRLRARVLESGGLEKWERGSGAWSNLVAMLHRFESDEIPGARVRTSYAGREVEVASDEEGYIDVAMDGIAHPRPDGAPEPRWREVGLELLEPLHPGQTGPVRVTAPVLTPPPDAAFGVISDVDDTIIKTGATSLLRNLRTTLLTAVEARAPFLGVPAFYRALERGTGETAGNPIFYVSSSPWNLFDLLERFMALNDIPAGPILLRDLGWDRSKFIQSRHADHKLTAIETLLAFYAGLRFILIGDSGQHDAAIYREVVRRHPDRVLAVYIRDLSGNAEGHPETLALLDEVRAAGVSAALCPDLLKAAENAAGEGWIAPGAVEAVRAEVTAARAG